MTSDARRAVDSLTGRDGCVVAQEWVGFLNRRRFRGSRRRRGPHWIRAFRRREAVPREHPATQRRARLAHPGQPAGQGDQVRPRLFAHRTGAIQREHPQVPGLRLRVVEGHVAADPAGGDRDVLDAVELVGDGAADDPRAGLELPEHLSARAVDGHEVAAHVAGEDETRGGGYRARPEGGGAHHPPEHLAVHHVEPDEVAGVLARQVLLVVRAQVPLPERWRLELVLRPEPVAHRPLVGHEVERLALGVVGQRLPVDRALEARDDRPDLGPSRLRHHVRVHVGPAGLGVESEGPVDARDDGVAVEEAAVRPVERVEEAVLVVVEERLHRPVAGQRDVGEHGGADRVVVPAVPGGVLEAPADRAVVGVDGDRRRGPLVVALPDLAVPGGRVSGVPVDEVQFGIEDAGGPGGASPVLPGVAGPGLVPRLARTRDRVGRPAMLPAGGVVRLHEAAHPVLAAGHAGEDHPVHHQRRAGDAVAVLPVGDLDLPDHLSAVLVERHQPGVHGADVDEVSEEGDPAIDGPAAEDAFDLDADLGVVAPQLPAGAGVDREDARLVRGQVDHALVQQRGGLEAAVRAAGGEHPDRMEVPHVVRRDLLQFHVAVGVVVAAVHEPLGGVPGRGLEIGVGDALARRRHRPAECRRKQERGRWTYRGRSHLRSSRDWKIARSRSKSLRQADVTDSRRSASCRARSGPPPADRCGATRPP